MRAYKSVLLFFVAIHLTGCAYFKTNYISPVSTARITMLRRPHAKCQFLIKAMCWNDRLVLATIFLELKSIRLVYSNTSRLNSRLMSRTQIQSRGC